MDAAWLGLPFALAAAASAALTWAALRYARRRQLLDAPGRRRSHTVATPRGGGIAIVLVVAALALSMPWAPNGWIFATCLLLVAGIGWVDDHRPLRVSTRLLVHVVAAAVFVASLPRDGDAGAQGLAVGVVQVVLLVGAINLWNFMDGINGLVTTQSIFIALVAAVLLKGNVASWHVLAFVLGGACLGFLPYNFPRARIFLGDVGSGGLGFACGALLLQAQAVGAVDALGALVAMSVIGLDASLTLLSRMALGRRWYDAHREHLYQWLVRRGRSHARVTSLYLLWNLFVVLPVLALMRSNPAWSTALGAAALGAGAATWWLARRYLLRGVRA